VEYVNIRERRGQGNQGRNCFEENYKVSINNEKKRKVKPRKNEIKEKK
jgi:hypothetical protein